MHADVGWSEPPSIDADTADEVVPVASDLAVRVVLEDLLLVRQARDHLEVPVVARHGGLGADDGGVDVDVGVLDDVQGQTAAEARVAIPELEPSVYEPARQPHLLDVGEAGVDRGSGALAEEVELVGLHVVEVVVVPEHADTIDLGPDLPDTIVGQQVQSSHDLGVVVEALLFGEVVEDAIGEVVAPFGAERPGRRHVLGAR